MSTSTANPIARTRPTLDIEAMARRNCRNNLRGLTVTDRAGTRFPIRSTEWDADGKLTIQLRPGGEFFLASLFTLAEPWPFKCCRGRLDVNGWPRRNGGR